MNLFTIKNSHITVAKTVSYVKMRQALQFVAYILLILFSPSILFNDISIEIKSFDDVTLLFGNEIPTINTFLILTNSKINFIYHNNHHFPMTIVVTRNLINSNVSFAQIFFSKNIDNNFVFVLSQCEFVNRTKIISKWIKIKDLKTNLCLNLPNETKTKKDLIVGVREIQPYFFYTNEMKPAGVDWFVIETIARKHNLKIEIVECEMNETNRMFRMDCYSKR